MSDNTELMIAYKCPLCGALACDFEWNTASALHWVGITFRVEDENNRQRLTFLCPHCSRTTHGSNIEVVNFNSKEVCDATDISIIKNVIKVKIDNEKRNIQNNIKRFEERVAAHKQAFLESNTMLLAEMAKLAGIDNMKKEVEKKLNSELEGLKKIRGVKDYKVDTSGNLMLFTDMVYINHGGDTYKIGEFEIKISLIHGSITFKNLTWGGCGYGFWTEQDPHPHINGNNGEACFGDAGTAILEALSKFEIRVLAMILISFLESVNVNDPAGAYIVYYPKIKEDGTLEFYRDDGRNICRVCDEEVCVGEGAPCGECGEIAHYACGERLERYDDIFVCVDCLNNRFGVCEECEDCVYPNDLVFVDGKYLCGECVTRLEEEREKESGEADVQIG